MMDGARVASHGAPMNRIIRCPTRWAWRMDIDIARLTKLRVDSGDGCVVGPGHSPKY